MKTYTILLVEDDATLSSTLTYNLTERNWQVETAASFAEAELLLTGQEYDLVILDVNLPDGNGYTLCRKYREYSNNPVVFLTANDMEMDELHGYDLGADDYVTKPFSVNVFMKKAEAILKRLDPQRDYGYSDGFLTVDFEGLQVSIEDRPVSLSALEFKTLRLFIENAGIVLTRSVFQSVSQSVI